MQMFNQVLQDQGYGSMDEAFDAIPAGTRAAHAIERHALRARVPGPDRGMAQEPEAITSPYDLLNIGGKMKAISLTKTVIAENERPSFTLVATLRSTLLVFLLFFPVTFMHLFLHEAGHALVHLIEGDPVHFLYAHPFSFVGYVRPGGDYYSIWVACLGNDF